jgi:signal transduction histidine kinase
VIDTGIGIESDILPRLFNEVLQINAAETQDGGGSGLGLVLTKGTYHRIGSHNTMLVPYLKYAFG